MSFYKKNDAEALKIDLKPVLLDKTEFENREKNLPIIFWHFCPISTPMQRHASSYNCWMHFYKLENVDSEFKKGIQVLRLRKKKEIKQRRKSQLLRICP